MKLRYYKKVILIAGIFFIGIIPILQSQDFSELEDQAKLLFSYEEYEMAKILYDSLFMMDDDNANYAQSLGDCYLNTSYPEIAIKYYKKVISLAPMSSNVFYTMASAYDLTNKPDSAILFFKKYHQRHELEANVCNRIAILYLDLENSQDSAIKYAQKAISVDPNMPDGYYTLSMIYVDLLRFKDAIYTAQAGINIDNEYGLLYMPLGLGHFYQKDYTKAIEFFEKGWKIPGLEKMFVNYLAFSKLLANTSEEDIDGDFENISFNSIKMKNLDKIIASTRDPQSKYYYSKLLKDFQDNFHEFGLDDYAMFYIGFTNDMAYLPYKSENLNLNELLQMENYDLIQELTENKLDTIPTDFPLYWWLSKVSERNSDYFYQLDNLLKYYGFSQAILATGDGASEESAFLITFIHHEYEIMYQLGMSVLEQTLLNNRDHSFDVLKGTNNYENEKSIYFNIDLPLSALKKNTNYSGKKNKKRKLFH